MPQVSVIFHSGSGHTAKMAEAVAAGAASVAGTDVKLLRIVGEDITAGRYSNDEILATLDASDAIIFGSPTYMGMVSGQFKCFADATSARWYTSAWANKLAAGFTVSGMPSGDKLSTLSYLQVLTAQLGMVWVGVDLVSGMDPEGRNRLGSNIGAMGQAGQESPEEAPNDADKATGAYLGKRVAEWAARIA